MESQTNPPDASVDRVVMRSERDITFEQAIFAWFQSRGQQLLKEPNHPEFQVRYDENQLLFAAILTTKAAMLSPERRRQIEDVIEASFGSDDE